MPESDPQRDFANVPVLMDRTRRHEDQIVGLQRDKAGRTAVADLRAEVSDDIALLRAEIAALRLYIEKQEQTRSDEVKSLRTTIILSACGIAGSALLLASQLSGGIG